MSCHFPRLAPRNNALLKGMNDALGNDLIDGHNGLAPYQVKDFLVLRLWARGAHSFHSGEVEQREALSIPGAKRSRRARKRVRRGFGLLRRTELHKRN